MPSQELTTQNEMISSESLQMTQLSLASFAFVLLCSTVEGASEQTNRWPFMAALLEVTFDDKQPLHQTCAGVLWNGNTVLTAAHCIIIQPHNELLIYLGNNEDLTEPIDSNYLFGVKQLIPHPSYNVNPIQYDLGLIRLNRSFEPNSHLEPVPYAASLEVLNLSPSACVSLGWNVAKHLTVSQLSPQPPSYCQQKWLERAGSFGPEHAICARYPDEGLNSTAINDSGGPLLCSYQTSGSTQFALAGLHSHPYRNYEAMNLAYFTKVEPHISWINENVDY